MAVYEEFPKDFATDWGLTFADCCTEAVMLMQSVACSDCV